MKKYAIILICGKNPLRIRSGYSSYAYSLAKNLTALGYSPHIYCCDTKQKTIKSKIGTIYILKSKLLTIPFFQTVGMSLLPFLAVKIALAVSKNEDTDLIIWGIGPWTLAGILIKLWSKKRSIVLADYFTSISHEFQGAVSATSIDDYGLLLKARIFLIFHIFSRLYSLIEKFILQRSDKIIVHYVSTEKIVMKDFAIPKKRFITLPYSLLNQEGKKYNPKFLDGLTSKKPLILLVCRHDARKGINYLLHAFQLLQNQNIKYSAVLVGNGIYFSENKSLARKLNLKNVYFLGTVENIKSLFQTADLYVFPSVEEGSSALSIIEAMREGLPIVTTNVDGIPEDISDGISGILVRPYDPQALAQGIKLALNDTQLALKIGYNAKKTYEKKFNTNSVRQSLKIFLSSLFLQDPHKIRHNGF